MRNPMAWLSGADAEVLKHFPGDRPKYTALGAVMTVTGTLAGVSMWFALHTALRLNAIAAICAAVAWGTAIIAIDRSLVVALQRQKSRRQYLVLAAPRLLLALLLGFVISTPVTLQIFAPEIDKQIPFIQQQNSAVFYNNQATQGIGKQIQTLEGKINTAQNQIIAAGAQDPKLADLSKKYLNDQAQATADRKQWQCQLYGGAGCPAVGSGPVATADYNRYQANLRAVTVDLTDIAAQQKLDKTTSNAVVTKATQEITLWQSEVMTDSSEQNQQDTAFNAKNVDTTGLLIRLQALDQLTSGDFNLFATRWLLFLLFATFEILPVLTKILQNLGQESAYDGAVQMANDTRKDIFEKRLKARAADVDKVRKAQEDAWEQARQQVVADLKARYVRKSRETVGPPADSTPGPHGRERRPREHRATRRPSHQRSPIGLRSGPAPRSHIDPISPSTESFLQEYKPWPAQEPSNGHGPAGTSSP